MGGLAPVEVVEARGGIISTLPSTLEPLEELELLSEDCKDILPPLGNVISVGGEILLLIVPTPKDELVPRERSLVLFAARRRELRALCLVALEDRWLSKIAASSSIFFTFAVKTQQITERRKNKSWKLIRKKKRRFFHSL